VAYCLEHLAVTAQIPPAHLANLAAFVRNLRAGGACQTQFGAICGPGDHATPRLLRPARKPALFHDARRMRRLVRWLRRWFARGRRDVAGSGIPLMERRAFLGTLVGGLLAAPLAAEAQPTGKSYRVCFLALTPGEDTTSMKPLRDRLHELGYREGKNMAFEYRSAEGHPERLPQLAMELVRGRPDVLVAGFGTLAAQAAKATTMTIPIVFTTVGDPVRAGLVASLGRPGGNVTGLSGLTEIGGKHLQLLQELSPGKQVIAVLMNPETPFTRLSLKEIKTAAAAKRTQLEILEARTADQVPRVFQAAVTAGAGGLLVIGDPLMYSLSREIVDLSAKFQLPAMYPNREWAETGGLMSYGTDRRQVYRRAAEYVDKILRGAKPGDLPVEQPTKFELVINLKTAKALGLTIPPSLLQRADQVIE
jgi:putative ABC transport system substrate-binding protein